LHQGTVQPFKVLEPVDDAVERMSSAIFYIGVMAGNNHSSTGVLWEIWVFGLRCRYGITANSCSIWHYFKREALYHVFLKALEILQVSFLSP
jgi:hypothetical protein